MYSEILKVFLMIWIYNLIELNLVKDRAFHLYLQKMAV